MVWVVRKKARNEGGERLKKKEKRGAVSSRVFFSKRENFSEGKKVSREFTYCLR